MKDASDSAFVVSVHYESLENAPGSIWNGRDIMRFQTLTLTTSVRW